MGSFLDLCCRWVPATFDRVELVHEDSGERTEVHVSWLYQHACRETIGRMYLKGKAKVVCAREVWRGLQTAKLVA